MNVISCDTCRWRRGSSCKNEYGDCLQNKNLGKLVKLYSSLPKKVPQYTYAHWEPNWNPLPDDLFEI